MNELVTQHEEQLRTVNEQSQALMYDEKLKDIHNLMTNWKANATSDESSAKNKEANELK